MLPTSAPVRPILSPSASRNITVKERYWRTRIHKRAKRPLTGFAVLHVKVNRRAEDGRISFFPVRKLPQDHAQFSPRL